MTHESPSTQPNTTVVNVCYSLPRFITMGIQCTFCAYFFEMYTGEFGWTHAEYGKVPTIYSGTQIVSFIVFGGVFLAIDLAITVKPSDGAEVKRDKANQKLDISKGILMGGTILHWITYFFLILLPIGWYGVKLPGIALIGRGLAKLGNLLSTGRLSGRNYLTPYEVTKITMADRERKRWWLLDQPSKIGPMLADSVPDPPLDFGLLEQIWASMPPEPGPTRASAWCCFGPCCRALCRCVCFKKGIIYLLTIFHGLGVSAHELSNGAIASYIYINPSGALSMNLTFFFVSNLFVYFIFSFVKLLSRSKATFSVTFVVFAILFGLSQAPILYFFFTKTEYVDAQSSKGITGSVPSYVCLILKFLSLTTWHGTIVFFIFSGGPLTNYVANNILGGDKVLSSFGNLVLFGALTATSLTLVIITTFLDPAISVPIAGKLYGKDETKEIVTGACTVCGFIAIMTLYQYNYWWNRCHWLSYILFILTGIVNSVFVTYTNVMMGGGLVLDARARDWKWIFNGFFYSLTNAVVSWGMPRIFNAFGQDGQAGFRVSCIQIILDYCFPGVYKSILMLFIVANIIANIVYWIAHHYDHFNAALVRFAECADLKAKVAAFKDHSTADAQLVNKFKAAAASLHAIGDELMLFGILLYHLSLKPKCGGLLAKKTKLQAAAGKFREACGQHEGGSTPANSFQKVSDELGKKGKGLTGFDTASDKFGKLIDVSAAAKFHDFAQALQQASQNCTQLRENVEKFVEASFAFQQGSRLFNTAAQKIKSNNPNATKLNSIKTSFQDHFNTAAGTFAEGAKELYEALRGVPILY